MDSDQNKVFVTALEIKEIIYNSAWEGAKDGFNYGFLIGAKPSSVGYTDYVAYFFDPEMNEWNLIAQFRRPKTTTYLKRLYSFLENFIPAQVSKVVLIFCIRYSF